MTQTPNPFGAADSSAESANPFAPPKAIISDADTGSNHSFYVVSLTKFWVLSIATSGIYLVYWFYKNWAIFKEHCHESIWPVPRAIFSIFFVAALLRRVETALTSRGIRSQLNVVAISTTYIVASVMSYIFDRVGIAVAPATPPILLFACSTAITAIRFFALSQAQVAINIACGDENGASNSQFTGVNWVWIVVGAIVWVFVILRFFAIQRQSSS